MDEPVFTLQLKVPMINVIAEALANVAYRAAAPVLDELKLQISKQQASAANPEPVATS